MSRFRYVELLADLGLEGACKKQPALIGGINTRDGRALLARRWRMRMASNTRPALRSSRAKRSGVEGSR